MTDKPIQINERLSPGDVLVVSQVGDQIHYITNFGGTPTFKKAYLES